MTECPQCFANFKGYKCTCGYVPKAVVAVNTLRESNPEHGLTKSSQDWLRSNRVHSDSMSRKEKTAANLAYIKRLQLSTPKAAAEPHAWAYEVLTKIADGEVVHPHSEFLARQVTGIQREEREAA